MSLETDWVEVTLYRSLAGQWFLVPACLKPSIALVTEHGDLSNVRTIRWPAESELARAFGPQLESSGYYELDHDELEQVAFPEL